ncbi:histidine phosphatase family protein [Pseudotabrizicola formosa]|uniref:histidine phosphatase family protein n=1 Tax=Pseudotabrizicola formosa TaxID=2030009 RepID=UPI000CD08F80|nr:histidine phosphatase family protein [Pseudotabrizicola formosa]
MRMFLAVMFLFLVTPLRADPLDAARAPGAVVLMRHATAPGTGDPPGFRLGDCATQRNLSAAGQAEARAIGARFRAAGIVFDQILTSEWCRARDTADLLGLGPVTAFPPVNSFFANRGDEPQQTAALLAHLAALPAGARVLIVTHQVNITALTGIVPRSGEAVVAQRMGQGLQVTGRLPPP